MAFRKLLAYLYSDTLELDDEVVIDVMRKAREYGLDRAYNMCMRFCVRHAAPSSSYPDRDLNPVFPSFPCLNPVSVLLSSHETSVRVPLREGSRGCCCRARSP